MKKLNVPLFLLIFYYWSWGKKKLSGTLVRIPIWILPAQKSFLQKSRVLVQLTGWYHMSLLAKSLCSTSEVKLNPNSQMNFRSFFWNTCTWLAHSHPDPESLCSWCPGWSCGREEVHRYVSVINEKVMCFWYKCWWYCRPIFILKVWPHLKGHLFIKTFQKSFRIKISPLRHHLITWILYYIIYEPWKSENRLLCNITILTFICAWSNSSWNEFWLLWPQNGL